MSTTVDSERVKTQRASARASLTRIKNLVESKKDTLSLPDLECRLGILESYFKQVLSYHTSYETLSPDDVTNTTYRTECEETYIAAKASLVSLINQKRNQDSHFSELNQSFAIKSGSSGHNLHKIKLPSSYSSLDGIARNAVREFQISEDNYIKILKHLDSRFNNKTLMFQELIAELFQLPKINKVSATNLRSLVDNVNAILSSMLSIGSGEDIANSMIIYVVMGKLDQDSQNRWEESVDFSNLLSWQDCSKVLSKRCQFLECREAKQSSCNFISKTQNKSFTRNLNSTVLSVSQSSTRNSSSCPVCGDSCHTILKCSKFAELSVMERFERVKALSLCINCLKGKHPVKKCTSSKCKVCSSSHHTMLHRFNVMKTTSLTPNTSNNHATNCSFANPVERESPAVLLSSKGQSPSHFTQSNVILATAIVNMKDRCGIFRPVRALLDSGSQLNFITDQLANELSLKKRRVSTEISGIANANIKINFSTQAILKSRVNEFTATLDMLVLQSIAGPMPDSPMPTKDWDLPKNIELADPHFFVRQRVDILIGAELFFQLMSVGQIRLGENMPILQKTLLGWIISGGYKSNLNCHEYKILTTSATNDNVDTTQELQNLVKDFWKIESPEFSVVRLTNEQSLCENFFTDTVKRSQSGRIIVKLPFKHHFSELGSSREIAERRFYSLETRLNKNAALRAQYSSFIDEYHKLDHLDVVPVEQERLVKYYLPHHCVLKPDSSSTKLRVVFDGSCATTSGLSLNDILMVGPTVQEDLYSILLRFRLHKYALKADICKMYRQFLVDDEDSYYQCILWRKSSTNQLRTLRLKTVTYGTSAAPYLATKSLSYLATLNFETHPIGAKKLLKDMYVDDLLSGGNSLEEINRIKNEIEIILSTAGMDLKKWYSNNTSFLNQIPVSEQESLLFINGSSVIKTLGICWQPTSDMFKFGIDADLFKQTKVTKRTVLSDTARLFDPIGFINPVIVKSKIFLQRLWLLKLDWDESLPLDLHSEWENFRKDLFLLDKVSIPRFVLCHESSVRLELHGFCDASSKAYGSCIYLRCIDSDGKIYVNLLTAKSKIAPIKTQSIPRLELCSAYLLANLINKLYHTLDLKIDDVFLWTDSEIVLCWISAHSSTWAVFVANRVSEIQQLTENYKWKHVNSKCNAADILSRGSSVSELVESNWFVGPDFLKRSPEYWPVQKERELKTNIPEKRSSYSLVVTKGLNNNLYDVISNFSSYNKIVNIFSYIIRFLKNCKYKGNDHLSGTLTKTEDSVLLLKVGGRLRNANVPHSTKFPIFLPNDDHFVQLLITHLHIENLHAGPQALLATVRQRFWITNGRAVVSKIVHKCIRCFKFKPKLAEQIMGDLPKSRVQLDRAFLISGVDFCGPVLLSSGIRGKKLSKAYIAVFVCFATHAVHLDLVSSLTSDAFIACLKRFTSRRGLCHELYCDNATNFVGARHILQDLSNKFKEQQFQNEITQYCSHHHIEFHHIPARSPHFGGLWEAAVKSAKFHLNRCCLNTNLTYEEMSTLLAQIESILNSRPIIALSSDPSDNQVLTPGHFIVGGPLNAIPEPSHNPTINISSLKRFHRISFIQQNFWSRWYKEYLTSLQRRNKWSSQTNNLTIGTLVLIGDDNLPPQHWLIGRIVKLYPGSDNCVRVVDVQCRNKIFRRQIHSLAPIPIAD